MKTLLDFSEEPKYSIKTVCTQTGIRAVTLRAWERRHDLLTPHRSENRYRLYSERDVAILRWIKSQVDSGMPISSAVNELHSLIHNSIFPEAMPSGPTRLPVQPAMAPEHYIRQLYPALIAHDEGKAGDIFRELQANFDLAALCQTILIPVLVEIGEAWYGGKIGITTEHFASVYIRGKLLTMFQSYPIQRGAPYILVGCAPDEQHELGSLMMAVLLRSGGYRVEYLGPDIPVDDLVDYASYEHPDLIILTASLETSALELLKVQEKLGKLRPAPLFGYGGAAFVNKPELKKRVHGVYLGDSIDQGLASIRSLISNKKFE